MTFSSILLYIHLFDNPLYCYEKMLSKCLEASEWCSDVMEYPSLFVDSTSSAFHDANIVLATQCTFPTSSTCFVYF